MDREARATGAGASFEVNEKTYTLRPLTLRQLQEVQREALRTYKRQILQTYSDSVEFLANGQQLLEKKIEEISRWDISDIPAKTSYDLRGAVESDAVKEWIETKYGRLPESRGVKMHMLSMALDTGDVTKEELEKIAGTKIATFRIAYDNWWVSSTLEGMTAFVWASVGGTQAGVSIEEIRSWPVNKLTDAATLVESITAPDMGNT